MNGILRGLGDTGEDLFSFDESALSDAPVLPDIPVDDGSSPVANATLPDFPTVFDTSAQEPQVSSNLDLINKVFTVGAKAYQYVASKDSKGRTVAVARPVQKASIMPWIVLGLILIAVNS